MQFRKPTSWAGVALLILLLGIAGIFSLMGWNASGIEAGDISTAGPWRWCAASSRAWSYAWGC